jgi:hypothetical protein
MSDPTAVLEFSDEYLIEETDVSAPDAVETATGEPTTQTNGHAQAEADAGLTPIPLPPIPKPPVLIRIRPVSGRYRGTSGAFQLEARVDVDRSRPTRRISGDFFQATGGTTSYFGSFVVNAPTVTVTAAQIVVRGLGTFTFSAGAPVVEISIPRKLVFFPQAPATVRFFGTNGSPGAVYVCNFESTFFRTVLVETDSVSDVTTPVFASYDTSLLPSGGASRNLSVVSAYAEAGIEMIPTQGSDIINAAEAGASWSNAELHASMEKHFSLWRDLPQWAVWQLVAQLHDQGSSLYGIMFDQQGRQRQGCAVFHQGIGGTTADKLRLQLYTYVHELGHCFNLMHSWQKQYASPPLPNRPDALSWMNYPWYYPNGGPAVFWARFPFQFDNEEIIHLRHAFRNNIVMGGNDFTVGASLGRDVMADPLRDDSGLTFSISTHKRSFALGEPVVLQLALSTQRRDGQRVHSWLHPNFAMVKVVIQKPNGTVVAYEPLIDHLVGEREASLRPGETIQDSAYIGYGKDGLYFGQPGHYQIRAVYASLDGSQVLSNLLDVRVRYPVTAAEEEIADLFMGHDQGTLLYLLGSDSDTLQSGNNAFDQVLDKYPKHEMANYVRLIKGFNAGRSFKTINGRGEDSMTLRPAKPAESAKLLATAADSGVLDPVTTVQTLTALAGVQDDEQAVKATLNKLAAMAIRRM